MSLKIQPDFEAFAQRSRQGNLIPVWAEILADMDTPVSVFRRMADGEFAFLLESVEHGAHIGRYSFIGCNPETLIRSRGDEINLIVGGDERVIRGVANPLDFIRDFMARYKPSHDPDLPPFLGGGVGYMAYDLVRSFEQLPDNNPDELHLPDSYFMITDTLVIFDHLRRRVILLANAHVTGDPRAAYNAAVHKVELLAERLRMARRVPDEDSSPSLPRVGSAVGAPGSQSSAGHAAAAHADRPAQHPVTGAGFDPGSGVTSNLSRQAFEAGVERIREYIRAGDAFQVVFSQRFSRPFSGDPFDIYRALRAINPSPYMFYLKFGELQLAGSSPEILVQVNHGEVRVRPIAGTRPRGATSAEDRELESELLADPKECAEHIMLVDLGRNDVGRVAEAGSVSVGDLMVVERYSHVMHIVSNVTGRLCGGRDMFDTLAACYPAGTVSGAPKIRAMQIIDEVENVRRGPYAGAVGYFSFDGNLDTCITIRTCLIKEGHVYVQAGAGIVADSVPASEYLETCNKARAVLNAVELAEAGLE